MTAAIEFGWVSAHSIIKQKWIPNDRYRPVIDVDLQQQYNVGLHWHSAESIGDAG